MSRCFPFPPPGYEPKARPDDVHLIIKEKEKKRKKHKDKDKKERSKRKENDGGERDHKESKKRKREDKDKKDRKKDDQIPSEGKKNVIILVNQSRGELVTDSKPTHAIQDQETFPELGKRTAKDGGAPDNQMVQKITLAEKTNANKTEHSKMANGQSLNSGARRLGNGHVGYFNGENRNKIEGGSCKVDKVEKRKDGNGRNGYGTVFGEGDGCKNEDMKAKEMGGYRNIVGEGNGCKNDDQNRNMRALDKEEKMKQDRKEKIKPGSSDFSFLLNPKRDNLGRVTKHKELNGFSHGVRPNNTSRPALSCRLEKGAAITNQKGNHEISSPQSVINNHGLSNGLTSSHLIHIKKKTEPCPSPPNTVAKVSPIANSRSANEKIPSTVLENGRTIHKADVKEFRMNGSADGGKQTLLENGRTIHKADIKELRMNGSADGGKQTLLENGRTIHKTDIKELRMNGSVEGGKQALLENGRIIHQTDAKELRMNGSVEGGKQALLENGRTIYKTDAKELRMNASVEGGKQMLLENGRTIPKTDIKELRMKDSVEGGEQTLYENGRTIHKADIKESRMNGSVEGGKPTTSSKPSSASIKCKKPKPPHPDLKYLDKILSVPAEIELPQCDDEDWLFGCKGKRPKLASSPNQCTKQVWGEAMHLESAGVTALPYVIPY